MLNLIKKLYNDSRIRYLFFGGLTTLVNLGMFALLKGPCGIDYKISNFFSVAIAICFAFVVNSYMYFSLNLNPSQIQFMNSSSLFSVVL